MTFIISHDTPSYKQVNFEYSGGSRKGAGGAPLPLFLDQTEAQKAKEKFFWRPGPPLSQGLDDPPPFLKVLGYPINLVIFGYLV